MKRIVFYAPIKPPDHHIASGDRLIAQNLIKALTLAGYEVELASRFIAYSKRADQEILEQRKAQAREEIDRLEKLFENDVPDLWLTYHPYCKAPDWLGPAIAEKFNIPYVTVEAAKTGQGFEGGGDLWKNWRKEAQRGMKKADLHICLKPNDADFLENLLKSRSKIQILPPFFDKKSPEIWPKIEIPDHWRPNAPIIVTTGMMRPGKKLTNYEILAKALLPLQGLHWNLILVGDGPAMENVRSDFSPFDQTRLLFTGAVSRDEVLGYMKAADLFAWPGWKEPIGMVFLEAQLCGLPVAALDSMGVSLSVVHGETGLLSGEDDFAAYSENLMTLLSHPQLRRDLGQNAQRHVIAKHSLETAAVTLKQYLSPCLNAQ